MTTSKQPWFRFYSEVIRDRKLEYITRATRQPKAIIVGAWAVLLALANDSPEAGLLLLTEDIPLTLRDFEMETGLPADLISELVEQFITLDLLSAEDVSGETVYCIANWHKRQYKSDSSTERVQRYRERKAAKGGAVTGNSAPPPPEPDSNDDETLHGTLPKRCGNAPETETDTEAEKEQKKNPGADAPAKPVALSENVPVAYNDWLELLREAKNKSESVGILTRMACTLYPDKLTVDDQGIYGRIGKMATDAGSTSKMASLLWSNAQRALVDPLDYITAAIRNDKTGGNGRGGGPPPPKQRFITVGGEE